jgi:hypothetical protein
MNMLEVIRRGAEHSARQDRHAQPSLTKTLPCPFCGADPPLAARIAGRFVVACENEDCAAGPQVSAATLCDAWARWNRRAV